MIYIYCPSMSVGAQALADQVEGKRLRFFDGETFYDRLRKPVTVGAEDVIICWGPKRLPLLDTVQVVNSESGSLSSYGHSVLWAMAGLETVPFYDGTKKNTTRSADSGDPNWISRKRGNSLLQDVACPPRYADFWVYKLNLIKEFRVHSFDNRAIATLVKVPIAGQEETAHPWIRTRDTGWEYTYPTDDPGTGVRQVAHRAIKAIGLTFGAVDIGLTQEGRYAVLDVTTQPSLTPELVKDYAKMITRWVMRPKKERTTQKRGAAEPSSLDSTLRDSTWINPWEERERQRGTRASVTAASVPTPAQPSVAPPTVNPRWSVIQTLTYDQLVTSEEMRRFTRLLTEEGAPQTGQQPYRDETEAPPIETNPSGRNLPRETTLRPQAGDWFTLEPTGYQGPEDR